MCTYIQSHSLPLPTYLNLQVAVVPKMDLQLVGITSLFISIKYEEIYGPTIYQIQHIAADTYSTPQILAMEKTILKVLDYRLLKPYPIHFLRRYSCLANSDTGVHHIAKYFLDLSLLMAAGSIIIPSKKAAAAFLLSNSLLNKSLPEKVWTESLQQHTGYSLVELKETVESLKRLIVIKHGTERAEALQEKYVLKSPAKWVKELLCGKELVFETVHP